MLQTSPGQPVRNEASFPEFVALIALMMALTALSVDIMLPALGEIGRAIKVETDNGRQLVITFYLLGFSVGQLFFGPLSDHYGRKRPLYAGLLIFAAGAVLALVSESAGAMFAGRAMQGFGAAAPRVIAIAIVRDRFAGRKMARVMSFVMMVFIVVPVLAPSVGQGVLEYGPWRWIFLVLLAASIVTLVWSALRLPETRGGHGEGPMPFSQVGHAMRVVVGTRQTVGYAVAFGFIFGTLMSYIGSAEQIFVDVYGLGRDVLGLGLGASEFPLVFGAMALLMLPASLLNSQLVGRLGMRRVSHVALAMFIAACGAMALAGFPAKPPLALFCLYAATTFFCFGLMGPNFNALAMEPMGAIAGTASSFIGFYTTGAAALFGWMVGQSFDGSVRPLAIGYTLLSLAALAAVLVTERGEFGRSHPEPPEQR